MLTFGPGARHPTKVKLRQLKSGFWDHFLGTARSNQEHWNYYVVRGVGALLWSWQSICSSGQKNNSLSLNNQNVHSSVQKNLPLQSTLGSFNRARISHSTTTPSIMVVSSHLHLGLPHGLVRSGLQTTILRICHWLQGRYTPLANKHPWAVITLKNTRRRANLTPVMKFLIMPFSPLSS